MKINTIIDIATALLSNLPTPRLDSEIILSYLLNTDKEYLIINPNLNLNNKVISRFFYFLGKRKSNYPISYITKNKEFYGINFKVNKYTLIPRPETEEIIDLVIRIINIINKKNIKIIDLGTGSGCIAISLIKKLNDINTEKTIHIDAIDVSKRALELAKFNYSKINNTNNKFRLNFKYKNYTNGINDNYDIYISNPPYLDINEIKNPTIKYEPSNALLGGKDGNYYYKIINNILKSSNKKNYYAVLEINSYKIEEYKEIFNGLALEFIKDYNNNYRYLIISPQ